MLKKTILIVDDEPDFRSALQLLFERLVPEALITEAEDGKDAYDKLIKSPYDLLITDIRMPRMDGERLLSSLPTLPGANRPKAVIVLSGNGVPGSQALIGQCTFVSKPFDFNAFGKLVREKLNLSEPQTKAAETKIDLNFISPFIESTIKVIEINARIKVTKEAVFIRKSDQASGDISALISMNSEQYLGSMAIAFEEKCFLGIVGAILGDTFTSITADIQDAAGEICNQVYGLSKRILNERGHTLKPSFPLIVCGQGHSIKHQINGTCIAVTFSTPHGRFTVETVVLEKVSL